MNLTTQLRIVLLLAGGGLLLLIYLLGRRREPSARVDSAFDESRREVRDFGPTTELDEAELETPAYMRRPGGVKLQALVDESEGDRYSTQHAADDFDAENDDEGEGMPAVRIGTAREYIDVPVMASRATRWDDPPVPPDAAKPAARTTAAVAIPEPETAVTNEVSTLEPTFGRDKFDMAFEETATFNEQAELPMAEDEPQWHEATVIEPVVEPLVEATDDVPEISVVEVDDDADLHDVTSAPEIETAVAHAEVVEQSAAMPVKHPLPVARDAQSVVVAREPPTVPSIHYDTPIGAAAAAPTLSEVVQPSVESSKSDSAAPVGQDAVVSESNQSAVAKPEAPKKAATHNKRKIIALRLSAPHRVAGSQLLDLLRKENLHHGRFDIFHRMHGDASVFSVASMVEPGSFDLRVMSEQQFPGVTFFMLLPGPLDGLIAYDQMLSCAQRLTHATNGMLQDERGNKLTHLIEERLREEVLNFQHLVGSAVEPIV